MATQITGVAAEVADIMTARGTAATCNATIAGRSPKDSVKVGTTAGTTTATKATIVGMIATIAATTQTGRFRCRGTRGLRWNCLAQATPALTLANMKTSRSKRLVKMSPQILQL